eukprot:2473564-Pyramimonas_sp.AAC.2
MQPVRSPPANQHQPISTRQSAPANQHPPISTRGSALSDASSCIAGMLGPTEKKCEFVGCNGWH